MTSFSEIVLTGRIVERLNSMGSWCGETHIQKSAYIAKIVEQVPLESEFILYKHGPYSFDLSATLLDMRAQNIVVATPQGGYGSSYSLNNGLWSAITRASGGSYDRYMESINFVCSQFAKRKVSELERVATAVFVRVNYSNLSPDEMRSKLMELKPHIGRTESALAFQEAGIFFRKLDRGVSIQQ